LIDSNSVKNEVINFWSSLNHQLDHDHDGYYPSTYLSYYIHDQNRYLSPRKLQDKLLNLEKLYDQNISVKKCVMISDVDFDKVKRASLRFFVVSDKKFKATEIKDKFKDDTRFSNVQCASDDNGIFAGYGFIELNDDADYLKLSNKETTVDDLVIVFS
jgi:hypothetical protein